MRYKLYSLGGLPVLKIYSIGYSSDIKETTFGPKKRDIYLIGYVLSGKGFYNNHPLEQGQGFVITPDIIEHIYPHTDDPWELLWFSSTDRKMSELLKYYEVDKDTYIFKHDSPIELWEIKERLIADNRKTINDAKMLEMFFSVFKYHIKAVEFSSANKTAAQRYIDYSVNYIKSNYSQNITVSELTKILGISQPYLYKIYKQAFGKSPKAFIGEYRIKQAKKILTETELSVSEVARSVGFGDPFAFSKYFSSKQGCSPTEYRNLHRNAAKPEKQTARLS